MSARFAFVIVIAVLATTIRPGVAEACSCIGRVSSATAVQQADLVFVGTVARIERARPWSRPTPDGLVTVVFEPEPPVMTFEVAHVYKGSAAKQIVMIGERSCGHPFKEGEAWLIYADRRDGRVATNSCTRTRLRSEALASQDFVFLDGLERGREQGVVHGEVLRRFVSAEGAPGLRALFEPLQVIAESGGRRTEITTDRWGPYQLVLAPGEYEVWVERARQPVSPRQTVRVIAGADRQLRLVADYKD